MKWQYLRNVVKYYFTLNTNIHSFQSCISLIKDINQYIMLQLRKTVKIYLDSKMLIHFNISDACDLEFFAQ